MRKLEWMTCAFALTLLGSLVSASAFDETKIKSEDLPKAVLKAAKKAMPDAKIVAATKETDDGETVYGVEFKVDGKSVSLVIDGDGEIEAVEKEIEVDDLPKAVIRAAAKQFPGGKITEAVEVTAEDDVVVYEVEIKVGAKNPVSVVMAPNGKILEDQDDEDDDKDKDKKAKGKAADKKESKPKK